MADRNWFYDGVSENAYSANEEYEIDQINFRTDGSHGFFHWKGGDNLYEDASDWERNWEIDLDALDGMDAIDVFKTDDIVIMRGWLFRMHIDSLENARDTLKKLWDYTDEQLERELPYIRLMVGMIANDERTDCRWGWCLLRDLDGWDSVEEKRFKKNNKKN